MLAVSCIVMGLVLASFVPSSASQTVADSRSPTQDDFGGGAPPPPPPPTDMSPPPDLDAFQPPDPTTPPDVDLGGTPPPPPPSETSSCPPDPNTAPDPTAPPSIDNCDPPSVEVRRSMVMGSLLVGGSEGETVRGVGSSRCLAAGL